MSVAPATPTKERPRIGDRGGGAGDAWRAIVLNDNHNTFDGVALAELALEQSQRQRVLDQPLQRSLQRPRAVGRVPSRLGNELLGGIRQLEPEPSLGQPRAQALQLQLDDFAQLLAREGLELD